MTQRARTGSMRGGVLVAAAVLLAAVLSLCLAPRVDAATASSLDPPWTKGVATTAADEVAAAAEEPGAAVVLERLDMEVSINDYQESRANGRHNPSHP